MEYKLSICIPTYNRGDFIGETLNSIVNQIKDNVEIVIVDGASEDNTKIVVEDFKNKYNFINYYCEEKNSGFDIDCDKSIKYAKGKYCWLMPDDDLMKPNAISRVLDVLNESHELIIVNSECWNEDFTIDLKSKMHDLTYDKTYKDSENETFFSDFTTCLSYTGSIIMHRKTWLSRNRKKYFGTLFVETGVIFESPPIKKIHVISESLIKIRYGLGMWEPKSFEIWYFKWPKLIWSFDHYSDKAKQKITLEKKWRNIKNLLKARAFGHYSYEGFKKILMHEKNPVYLFLSFIICFFPGKIANLIFVLYYSIFKSSSLYTLFDLLRSPSANVLSRSFVKTLNIKL